MKRIKRKLKTVKDPKMTSHSAGVTRKGAGAAAAPAAAPVKKTRTKKAPAAELHPADKDFNKKRRTHLEGQKAGAKAGVVKKDAKTQLAERIKAHGETVARAQKTAELQKTLQAKRKTVQSDNLKIRQKTADANLKARTDARLQYIKAKKPMIKDGKVVTPKIDAPVYTPKKPTLKPMPRLEAGKITFKPKVPKAPKAEDKAAGKLAAKTRKKAGAKAA